jgi:hypothetical protein
MLPWSVWLGMNISRKVLDHLCHSTHFRTNPYDEAMSNYKVQSSNEIQGSNEMPKQVRHDQGVILNSFQNPLFGICLPAVGRNFDIWI